MASTHVDVEAAAAVAAALPEVEETTTFGNRAWAVAGKKFAWLRPFSKADIKRFGDSEPPTGPILAVVVDDLGEKEAVLAQGHPGFFDIAHFKGFPGLLIALDEASPDDVRAALEDAWAAQAPARLLP